MIVIGGVAAFWITAIIIFSIVFAIGAELPIGDQDIKGISNTQVKIISVSKNSPADQTGLQARDTIKNIKIGDINTEIIKIADFQRIVGENKGKEISVTINRGGNVFDVKLTPRVNPPEGEGSVGIGLDRMATLIQKTAWYMVVIEGAKFTWSTTVDAMKGLYDTFAGLFSKKGLPEGASFAGPLGITVFLAKAANYGIGFFLYLIGQISVFIALFNLFPIPALDGGKLVFLLIEKIKGKPVSVKIEQAITVTCFIILISLSLFITVVFDVPSFMGFIKSF